MRLLTVDQLSIEFHTRAGIIKAVNNASFNVDKGETLAIVGESGSGKSVTCYSMLGQLPTPPAKIASGAVWFDADGESINLVKLGKKQAEFLRTQQIAMVFQDPATSLNPYLTIGEQLMEPLLYHSQPTKRKQAKLRALKLLREVNITNPEQCFKSWPHQLSGGMRQRVMIAMALMASPKLLIADEPTTALDVTIQAQILELLKSIQQKHQLGIIFISHDLSVVASLADRIIVMEKGDIVEQGTPQEIFFKAQHNYTKKLIAAIPEGAKSLSDTNKSSEIEQGALLEIKNLTTSFNTQGEQVVAVNNVSLTIPKRQIIGLVGESGSGKSTLGRTLLRLVGSDSGEIIYAGKDLCKLSQRQLKPLRRDLQMVFQDPFSSLNPRMTLFQILAEPLLLHKIATKKTIDEQVDILLNDVGLSPSMKYKYPHEFSGGQRQRIAIGRALACKPKFIVADEPVSALDVTIQAQILELMQRLVDQYQLTMLFISHDLAVVRKLCDRVVVMHHGVIVEENTTEALFNNPEQEYTQQLIAAIPTMILSHYHPLY